VPDHRPAAAAHRDAPDPDGPVGVAVVGAGGWGKNHVRNFAGLAGARLRWVCDRSAEVRSQVSRNHPEVSVTEDLDGVLADGEVLYLGQPVFAVAATSFEAAQQAVALADIE